MTAVHLTNANKYIARLLGIAVFCNFFITPLPTQAANTSKINTDEGVDIAIVLDASGSMKQSDPLRMRVQAAKMFVTLLDKRDRVALLSFSGNVRRDTELLDLSKGLSEIALLNAIDKIEATGTHTNLHEALHESFRVLQANKKGNRERVVILMSDGKMDVGQKEKDLRLLEQTVDELTPKFAKNNIKIVSIAFTDNSYIPLLKLAAEDTRGQFHFLRSAAAIHQVFENIFERSKKPDMLVVRQDSFIVDDNVNELTIVASKFRPDSFIALENPSGIDYDETTKLDSLRWFSGKQFDLITIMKPLPGYWLIKFSEGGNKAYIVSDLHLALDLSKKNTEPGKPFQLQAWLTKKEQPIKTREILAHTHFSVTVKKPDGNVQAVKLTDDGTEVGSDKFDGIYGTTLKFDQPGAYRMEVTATSETFDRQKSAFMIVAQAETTDPFAVRDAIPSTAEPAPAKDSDAADVTPPIATQDEITRSKPAKTRDEVIVPVVADETPKPLPVEETKPVEIPPEALVSPEEAANENKSLFIQAVIGLILFNLIIIGGAVYFYYKKKKKNRQKADSQGIDLSAEGEDFTKQIESTTENIENVDPPLDAGDQKT